MNDLAALPGAIVSWQFLQEPLWRWFIFLFALGGMMFAWNGVLNLMK